MHDFTDERRLRLFKVSSQILLELLTSGNGRPATKPDPILPADIVLHDIRCGGTPEVWDFVIWSMEFEPIPEGAEPPMFYMNHTRLSDILNA